MSSKRSLLDSIYKNTEDSGSYGGVERLLHSARCEHKRKDIKKSDVEKYLQSENTYTLHKPIRRKFKRNPIIVKGIDVQWQADLADVIDLSRDNNGYHYILTVIDCFSKYAWAIPVKRKDSANMLEVMKTLLAKAHPRKPQRLQTDKGKEFINSSVQNYLKSQKIEHFVISNETKAAMVERFNRTIKTRMFAYFTEKRTRKYIDILQNLVDSYNNSIHHSTGMKPVDVTEKDNERLWHRMYGNIAQQVVPLKSSKKESSKEGTTVRISKAKAIFDKGYMPNWTRELFKVKKQMKRLPKTVYKLTDYADEDIGGTFYPDEVQKVKDKNVYEVERVLKRRTLKDGTQQQLVKWLCWPEKFNSWINATDIVS